jgi:hypothetical protein
MDPAPLENERLVTEDQRRLTVAEHHSWQKSISSQRPFDEVDEEMESAAEVIHDHLPQSAPKHKVNRVLNILDQLAQEESNRRFIR